MCVSFGQQVSQTRKRLGLSQKHLASMLKRDDGISISPQYLNDIEHDRRSPSSPLLIGQFSNVLGLDTDYLFYLTGRIPADVATMNLSADTVAKAMTALRRTLDEGEGK